MTYWNLPRDLNAAADDMCRRARAFHAPGWLELTPDQVTELGAPTVPLDAIYE